MHLQFFGSFCSDQCCFPLYTLFPRVSHRFTTTQTTSRDYLIRLCLVWKAGLMSEKMTHFLFIVLGTYIILFHTCQSFNYKQFEVFVLHEATIIASSHLLFLPWLIIILFHSLNRINQRNFVCCIVSQFLINGAFSGTLCMDLFLLYFFLPLASITVTIFHCQFFKIENYAPSSSQGYGFYISIWE